MRTMSIILISLSIPSLLVGCAGVYTGGGNDDFADDSSASKPYPVVETGDKVIPPPAGVHLSPEHIPL